MSEVNIDADLIRSGGAELSFTDESLVELSNGCICCTLRDDLLAEVHQLAAQGRFDCLLIESTGISEPLPVAATFEYCDDNQKGLADITRLDAMVTVVDTANLLSNYNSHDLLRDRGKVRDDQDPRTIVELLVDQIEFANIIILNKATTAGSTCVAEARKVIRSLNAEAKIIEADYGAVPNNEILASGLFSAAKARSHPLWFQELHGFTDHIPETEEYGISSFVFRSRVPFDAAKVKAVLMGPLPGVLRAKGHFCIASNPDHVMGFSLAGNLVSMTAAGRWWAAMPQNDWPEDADAVERILSHWRPPFGDRRQELVFIGTSFDRDAITTALEEALIRTEPIPFHKAAVQQAPKLFG